MKKPNLEWSKQAHCPFCQSWQVGYHDLHVDLGTVEQKAECYDCKLYWIEHYDMTRVEQLER